MLVFVTREGGRGKVRVGKENGVLSRFRESTVVGFVAFV